MAVSSVVLRKDILDILKDADLATMSSKKVRLQLAEKYGCDLQSRKDEIDGIIMDAISQRPTGGAPSKKASPKSSSKPTAAKTTNGRNKKSVANDDASDDDDNVSDDAMNCDKASDSDDNEIDDELLARKLQEEESASLRNKKRKPLKRSKPRKKKSEKSEDGTKTKRTTRYNEPCELSPELAAIVGEPRLPRHLVVKKMWQIVKERNLADPKHKQFMICDEQLMTVFGRKRVKTFGMMKYLNEHISSPNSASKRHQ